MSNYFSIVFGLVLGAVLSYFATEISARRRNKEEREKSKKNVTNDIIGICLQYIFKIKDNINDCATKKKIYLSVSSKFPPKADELKEIFYQEVDKKLDSGMFSELMFISYQLKRIEDNGLWKEFEVLANTYKKMFEILMSIKDFEEYTKLEGVFNNNLKDFVERCIDISKVQ